MKSAGARETAGQGGAHARRERVRTPARQAGQPPEANRVCPLARLRQATTARPTYITFNADTRVLEIAREDGPSTRDLNPDHLRALRCATVLTVPMTPARQAQRAATPAAFPTELSQPTYDCAAAGSKPVATVSSPRTAPMRKRLSSEPSRGNGHRCEGEARGWCT